jgi:hypothetical protein
MRSSLSASVDIIRGSFQKFCTLYVFSLKMNLFYKIHLQAFNVISVVLYHSGPTFGQVLYSSLDAFVFYVSMCLITQVTSLDTSMLPTEWFLQNKSKSGGLSPPDFDLFPKLKKPLRGKRFRSIEDVSKWGDLSNQTHQQRRRPDRNTRLSETLDHCDKAQWRLHWRPVNVVCTINSFLKRKHTVCRTFEMTHVDLHTVEVYSSLIKIRAK